ncbi:Gfo/Idh/MocA family protein [Pelagicoccus mobilis]|uniref:Gfo/Idh/MocA family oxidoreductase n=1 Tax=Pelagicoccus mobilis TaxID=415221 RepID=A0A934VTG2_9BACT|nr:Gfo/Idh/MocA family oxidoreductase [Pelagicoccus mobilis]MBK1879683.1 Gfo/Idh/MocA family oxidoreductase [Pelagicoccus mobilis]
MNRRTFINSLAAAGALSSLPLQSLRAVGSGPKIRVGLIGCGWFGNVDLAALSRVGNVEVVSLCDPNQKHLQQTLDEVSGRQSKAPSTYADFRKMLAADQHDVVIVGTPDHWHALPAIEAMKAGADVYLEKPISVDVMEGEALVAAARKYDRVVQVNLQRRSSPLYEEVRKKYLDTGKLGRIGTVECFLYGGGRARKIDSVQPPAHLDYDLWAGPAAKIPFVPPLESKGWRNFMEYGNGKIGDMGVHIFDLVRHLLGIGWPISVSSTGGIYMLKGGSANISDTQKTVFKYPDLDVTWEHRSWGAAPFPKRHWTDGWGADIIGEKGTLRVTTLEYRFTPKDGGSPEGRHMLSKTNNLENVDFGQFGHAFGQVDYVHATNFLEARQERKRAVSNIEEGHISSACCILGNVALEVGRTLKYDPATRTIIGDEEATKKLARPYRGDWEHPDPEKV